MWFGDVGYEPAHWEYTGRIPLQGGLQVDREVAKGEDGWDVGLPPTGGGNGRGGHTGGGDLCCPPQ